MTRRGSRDLHSPANNFYEYVNFEWESRTELPADRPSIGTFTDQAVAVEARLLAMMEDAASGLGEESSALTRTLYESFVRTSARKDQSPRLRDLLEKIDAVAGVCDISGLQGSILRLGAGAAFGVRLVRSGSGSSAHLGLKPAGLGLPTVAHYTEPRHAAVRGTYLRYLGKLFQLADLPDSAAGAGSAMEVELVLARSRDNQASRIRGVGASAAADICPNLDWNAFFGAFGASCNSAWAIDDARFFGHLSDALEHLSFEAWRNWLRARVLTWAAPYLSEPFATADFEFHGSALRGVSLIRSRSHRGMGIVTVCLGEAVGRMYTEALVRPTIVDGVLAMTETIRESFRRAILRSDWLAEPTMGRAITKLDRMRVRIGGPQAAPDLSGLHLLPDDPLDNVARCRAWTTDRRLRQLDERDLEPGAEQDSWPVSPCDVAARYDRVHNEVYIPAALLQRPFFEVDADFGSNFGALGALIAHEMSHALDDGGSRVDESGRRTDWWSIAERDAYQERADRLREQVSTQRSRSSPAAGLDGRRTSTEDIADVTGAAIAYDAFVQAVTKRDGRAPTQPASREFFYAWARMWRAKRRPEQAARLIDIDVHSPPDVRTNLVRNVDAFHAAFTTNPQDSMWLPFGNRVRIW